jgi:hypothetical protein
MGMSYDKSIFRIIVVDIGAVSPCRSAPIRH